MFLHFSPEVVADCCCDHCQAPATRQRLLTSPPRFLRINIVAPRTRTALPPDYHPNGKLIEYDVLDLSPVTQSGQAHYTLCAAIMYCKRHIWNPHTKLDLRYVWYISGIFHLQRYLWYISGIYYDHRFWKKCCLYQFHQINCFIMLKAYTKWLSVEMGNLLSEVMLCLTHSWDISGILLRYII